MDHGPGVGIDAKRPPVTNVITPGTISFITRCLEWISVREGSGRRVHELGRHVSALLIKNATDRAITKRLCYGARRETQFVRDQSPGADELRCDGRVSALPEPCNGKADPKCQHPLHDVLVYSEYALLQWLKESLARHTEGGEQRS